MLQKDPPDPSVSAIESFVILPLSSTTPLLVDKAAKLWAANESPDVLPPSERLNFDKALKQGLGLIALTQSGAPAAVTVVYQYAVSADVNETDIWYEIGSSQTDEAYDSYGLMTVIYALVNLGIMLTEAGAPQHEDGAPHHLVFAIVHPLQHKTDFDRRNVPASRGAMCHILDKRLGFRAHKPPEPLRTIRQTELGSPPAAPSDSKLWMMPASRAGGREQVRDNVEGILRPMLMPGRPGVLRDSKGAFEIDVQLPWFQKLDFDVFFNGKRAA